MSSSSPASRSLRVACAGFLVAASCLAPAAAQEAGVERLTTDGRLKLSPSFVDGGKTIVYSVHDVPNRVTLMRLDLASRSAKRVLPSTNEHQFDGTFSRDGRYLCYARAMSNPQLQLVIVDTRSRAESVYSPLGQRSTTRGPCFAPDSSRVVFTLSAKGGQQIASCDTQCGDLKKLTASPGINTAPAFSPDGKRIVFSSSRTGDLEIWVMNADGSDPRRLTHSRGLDMHPSWSPDGRRIAFTSSRDGNYEIWVMNADGSQPQNVTRHPERDHFPRWSPDGKHLLTVSERGGKVDLYLRAAPR